MNSFLISPQKQRTRTRPEPDHPFRIEGSEDPVVQEDLVPKFLRPCSKPDQGDRFECCLLSPCQPNLQIKALSFLEGQGCVVLASMCLGCEPLLGNTVVQAPVLMHFLVVYCLLNVH